MHLDEFRSQRQDLLEVVEARLQPPRAAQPRRFDLELLRRFQVPFAEVVPGRDASIELYAHELVEALRRQPLSRPARAHHLSRNDRPALEVPRRDEAFAQYVAVEQLDCRQALLVATKCQLGMPDVANDLA